MEGSHQAIRILFVEDNVLDLYLAERELRNAGILYESQCTDKKNDFDRLLGTYNPDIIISDFFLPEFDGLYVLKKVLEEFPDVPVIITTGSINEETAVTCMKAGAADYVLKDQYRRLPFAVKDVISRNSIRRDKDKAEKALIDSEIRYRNLVEHSPAGIFQTSLQGKLVYVNTAFARLLSYSGQQELLNNDMRSIFVYEDEETELIEMVTEQKSVTDFETSFVTRFGEQKDVLIGASIQEGIITGMVLDISDRKKAENELLKAKEKAEESDRLKSAFLSNLSHEVRTPMNGIVGFAELLLDPYLDDESKKEYVETIMDNSNQLLKIISDIIEISKIETEQLSINYKEFGLNEFLLDIEFQYTPLALKAGLEFHLNYDAFHEKLLVISDDQKIRLSVTHLLDNALKFTTSGSIDLNVSRKDSQLEIAVSDTGIGIPQEEMQNIFEPFRQVDESLSRRHGGNGLGLAICRAYVELLGGVISVRKNEPQGSVFTLSFPVRIKEEGITRALEIPDYSALTFLIAEDDQTNYAYIKRLLIPSGASLLHAETGRQVLDILEKNNNIHLILMDIKMPDINGLEATRIIKKNNPVIPVIATTAYAMDGDKELCFEAGCDGYVPKPIRSSELIREIRKVIRKES